MNNWKTYLGSLVAVVVLVGAGWVIYGKIREAVAEPEAQQRGRGVVPVEVAAVQTGLIRDVRTLTGSLEASAAFQVSTRISGRIERLLVKISDVVERGQVIAELDSEEYEQQLQQNQAELLVAQAILQEKRSALEISQREFRRVEQLFEQRIASESELDSARARLQGEEAGVQVADAQVARAQAAVRAAEVRLSYTRIRATWHGGGDQRVVGERFVNEGATVAANTPLLSLVDMATLTAVVHVTEDVHQHLRKGQEAVISVANGTPDVRGRVERFASIYDPRARQARVEIELPNPELRLNPGMFVRVSLELGRDEQATIVPRQALLRRDGREGVFLADVESGRARFVPLTIGIVERDRVQVLDPEISGHVVTLGQHMLGEGMPIAVVDDEARPVQSVGLGEAGR